MAEFEDALGGEAFVGAEDGVLIDGDVAGELADAGEAITGAEVAWQRIACGRHR